MSNWNSSINQHSIDEILLGVWNELLHNQVGIHEHVRIRADDEFGRGNMLCDPRIGRELKSGQVEITVSEWELHNVIV